MASPLRQRGDVQKSQRLVIPADAFNGFVDAANYVHARRHNTESDAADEFGQTGIVRVRNNTGFALSRFAVLALSEPIIGPAANLQEFKNKVNFEGGTPYDPVAAGRFAVLLEPLDINVIGRGIEAGIFEPRTPVLGCRCNTLSLRNAPAGSARQQGHDISEPSARAR